MNHWGERFKQLRESRGFSQEAVAALGGISRRPIVAFEAKGNCEFENVLAMINAIGLTPSEFFESKVPKDFASPERRNVHEKLETILDADGEEAAWISGNVEVFYRQVSGIAPKKGTPIRGRKSEAVGNE